MPLLIIAVIIFGISFWLYWTDRDRPQEPVDQELLKAAKGDRRRVQQMVAEAKQKHPGQSARWYHEKVLYDLQVEDKYKLKRTSHPRDRLHPRQIIESLVIFSLVASAIRFVAHSLGSLFRQ